MGLTCLGSIQRKHPDILEGFGVVYRIDKAPAVGRERIRPGESCGREQAFLGPAAVGEPPKKTVGAVPAGRIHDSFPIWCPTGNDVSALKSQTGPGILGEVVNPDSVSGGYRGDAAIG